MLNFPLMSDNIGEDDLDLLIDFLKSKPRLTQADNVRLFEQEWSEWLGVKYSVFVNSGSSANFLTMAALNSVVGDGEIIVPTLTWVSDIVSVLKNNFSPVFVDINPRNLCMDCKQVLEKINSNTKGVFVTHVQGFNGLSEELLEELESRGIPLIEDVCESHGARFGDRKLGSFGLISNFSFYFAHHMSTIEGGMICTNDQDLYQRLRMLRSHGLVRESNSEELQFEYAERHPDLSTEFIFAFPGFNMRNTEIGAVLGRSQLKKLDGNNEKRKRNFKTFLEQINRDKFRVDFDLEGSCNYAFNLILKEKDEALRDRLEKTMRDAGVEFRRGSSGGGNQLRQPYLRPYFKKEYCANFPEIEHVHFFGYYIGNYPDMSSDQVLSLCQILNSAV